jgi:hypothetical protein
MEFNLQSTFNLQLACNQQAAIILQSIPGPAFRHSACHLKSGINLHQQSAIIQKSSINL